MGYFKTEFCVSHIRYILLYYIVYKNATKIIRKNTKFPLFFSKNNAPLKAVRYILRRLHGNSIYFITKCVLVKIFLVIYSKYAVSFYPSVTHPRTQTCITLPITSFKCGAQQKMSGISARHFIFVYLTKYPFMPSLSARDASVFHIQSTSTASSAANFAATASAAPFSNCGAPPTSTTWLAP